MLSYTGRHCCVKVVVRRHVQLHLSIFRDFKKLILKRINKNSVGQEKESIIRVREV